MFDSPPDIKKAYRYDLIGVRHDGTQDLLQQGTIYKVGVEKVSNAARKALKKNWVGAGGNDHDYAAGYDAVFGKKAEESPENN